MKLTCNCTAYKFPHRKFGGACGIRAQELRERQELRELTASEEYLMPSEFAFHEYGVRNSDFFDFTNQR